MLVSQTLFEYGVNVFLIQVVTCVIRIYVQLLGQPTTTLTFAMQTGNKPGHTYPNKTRD